MKGGKLIAALKSRVAAYEALPNTNNGGKAGPSDNKNQIAHRPGSRNRKKGYGGRRSGR